GAGRLALADFEGSLRTRPDVSDVRVGRGLARVALGKWREAIADAEFAFNHPPDTAEMRHNLACIFAQTVLAAKESATATDVEAWRRRAVDALRSALKLVPVNRRLDFWRTQIRADYALDPIRDDTEFRR